MLRFIICEDNKEHLDRLCNIINKVMMPYNFEYKINKFTQYNKEVEEIINNKTDIKVYLLDIELPVISGLEIASEIRENDLESIIIFITAHNEFKNDIFYSRLLATDYISKNTLWTDRFEDSMNYIVNILEKRQMLVFDYNHNTYRIPYNAINYIEKIQDNQKCTIYTESGETFDIKDTVTGLVEKLGPNFFKSHKSCIINLDKVKIIDYTNNKIVFQNNEFIYLLSNRMKKALKDYVTNR